MSGQVLAFRGPRAADQREALIAALVPLHTLITLDPILGASPVRVYFVLNPQARERIAACLDPGDGSQARFAPAFALVAYDFPFALQLVEGTAPQMSREQAKRIVTCSAGLQGDALQAAARAFGIDARPITAFDAGALKAAFFPSTQETVTQLFWLAAGRDADGAPTRQIQPPPKSGDAADVRDA
jgi:3-hydroxypropanoate dehydrogenase